MIKNIIIATLFLIIGGLLFVDFTQTPSVVVTPEVQKTGDYKRPVREGNCWRQFIGTGDTDSILVCH